MQNLAKKLVLIALAGSAFIFVVLLPFINLNRILDPFAGFFDKVFMLFTRRGFLNEIRDPYFLTRDFVTYLMVAINIVTRLGSIAILALACLNFLANNNDVGKLLAKGTLFIIILYFAKQLLITVILKGNGFNFHFNISSVVSLLLPILLFVTYNQMVKIEEAQIDEE